MKRLLLLDNHDSFTFILRESLLKAGANEVDVLSVENFNVYSTDGYQGVVISPGPGTPKQNNLPEIIRNLAGKTPVLGICLGMQAIAEAFGGKIKNMEQVFHGSEAIVNHSGTALFTDIPNPFSAGLYHSWAVVQESLPPELKMSSISTDNVPMSLEHAYFPICGFQFHPESHITKVGIRLLSNFLNFYL